MNGGMVGDDLKNGGLGLCFVLSPGEKWGSLQQFPGTEGGEMFTARGGLGLQELG